MLPHTNFLTCAIKECMQKVELIRSVDAPMFTYLTQDQIKATNMMREAFKGHDREQADE